MLRGGSQVWRRRGVRSWADALLAWWRCAIFQNRCGAAILFLVVTEPLNKVILGAWDGQTPQFQFLFQLSNLDDEKAEQIVLQQDSTQNQQTENSLFRLTLFRWTFKGQNDANTLSKNMFRDCDKNSNLHIWWEQSTSIIRGDSQTFNFKNNLD